MVSRSPVELISENRALAAATALAMIMMVSGIALIASRGDQQLADRVDPRTTERDTAPGVIDDAVAEPRTTPAEETDIAGGAVSGPGRATVEGGAQATVPIIPGTAPGPACTPRPVEGTGITDDEIVIGQIVTDVSVLPQQLGPAHEGLRAYVDLVNAAGGVCGRTLRLEYRNDNMNPATHRSAYESLARSTFAFVGNHSLLDSQDYQQSPPFNPTFRDGGEFVPDVGGLAFSYPRSQSGWHAGVIGSLSPTLVGGGQVRSFIESARTQGTPCRRGAVVYLREPSGASEDQGRLLDAALQQPWGGNLGQGNTRLYAANLADPVPAYEVMVDRMIADGMNCVFAYVDLGSSINLVRGMNNRGIWPPDRCNRGDQCFRVTYIPLSAYDPKFIQDGGEGARGVSTFIPHMPLTELDNPVMRAYVGALGKIGGARPSTFSILGFASGQMFVEALQQCGSAPTRACVMDRLRRMEEFTAGGMLGSVAPFRTTRATFGNYGTFDWKWIFNCSVALRVEDRGGTRDFYRINPQSGFFCDQLNVARGTPA